MSVTALDTRQPLTVTESEKEIQISLGAEVLFDSGRFALRPAAADALQKVAVLVKSYGGLPVLIAGHTDSVGRPDANQLLSENRAAAVKEWLTPQGGVPAERITAKGYGQTAPTATNDTADGRQKNRRVEIRLQKTETKTYPLAAKIDCLLRQGRQWSLPGPTNCRAARCPL